MNKLITSFVVLLFIVSTMSAQSTERFIRIIGNSDHTYIANVNRVSFTVNEVAPNEYKKISYKRLETVYDEFVQRLAELGISERQIMPAKLEAYRYNKTKTKNYFVDVKDRKTLDGLSGLQNDGFKIIGVQYLYTNIDENIENELSLKAIKDAKRKAEKLCTELDMKLGKILNIEDRSSGCCTVIDPSAKSETNKKYKITITFELLDK